MGDSIEKVAPTPPVAGATSQPSRIPPAGERKGGGKGHQPQHDVIELHGEEETLPAEATPTPEPLAADGGLDLVA